MSPNFLCGSKLMSATDQNQKRHNPQYQDMLSRFNRILVIGLGQLGLPVAKYVKERGFDAYGYDISIKAVDRAEKIAEIKHAVDFGTEDFDDIFSPKIGLLSTADKLSKEAKIDRTPLSLESTIQSGTSKYLKCST